MTGEFKMMEPEPSDGDPGRTILIDAMGNPSLTEGIAKINVYQILASSSGAVTQTVVARLAMTPTNMLKCAEFMREHAEKMLAMPVGEKERRMQA